MSREIAPPVALREIRRGEFADELYLIATDGTVTILHAHGVHADERLRTRERALKLLETVTVR
jgi:hypothetical protein